MEARAAVACLGAHRRSPEAGERTLVPIEDSTTGHLFPVRRPSPSPETPWGPTHRLINLAPPRPGVGGKG